MINEDIITQVWEFGSDTIMPSNKQTDRRIDMILLTGEGMAISKYWEQYGTTLA